MQLKNGRDAFCRRGRAYQAMREGPLGRRRNAFLQRGRRHEADLFGPIDHVASVLRKVVRRKVSEALEGCLLYAPHDGRDGIASGKDASRDR